MKIYTFYLKREATKIEIEDYDNDLEGIIDFVLKDYNHIDDNGTEYDKDDLIIEEKEVPDNE
jgi:hypothetical protein